MLTFNQLKSKPIIVSILGLILCYLSFPNVFLHIGFLAWGCFVPLFWLIGQHDNYFKRLGVSWLFFQSFFFLLFWMDPFEYYERYETIWMVVILIAFYAIFPLLFASVTAIYTHKRKIISLLVMPTIWVLMEFAQTLFPIGFPLSIAASQYTYPIVIQIVQFTGIFGVSFLLMCSNVLLSLWVSSHQKQYLSGFIGLITINLIIGVYFLFIPQQENNTDERNRFILIQPNIKWRDAYYSFENNFLYKNILGSLEYLSSRGTKGLKEGTIVFPELTISDFNYKNPLLQDHIKQITNHKFSLVMGARHEKKNAVFSFSKDGNIVSQYNKSKLVPMFENNEERDNTASFPLIIDNKNNKLGAFICYESLFPSIARRLSQNGADFLGGVSFNSWLGNTNWAILHMSYLPFRAIENNRHSFFLNNNGPSIVSDNKGSIVEIIPLGKKGFIVYDAPKLTTKAFYTKHENLFLVILFCINGFIGLIGFGSGY